MLVEINIGDGDGWTWAVGGGLFLTNRTTSFIRPKLLLDKNRVYKYKCALHRGRKCIAESLLERVMDRL